MNTMVNLIFMCLALTVPVAHAQSTSETEDRPFHISSYNSAFGVQGEFEGTYRVTNSSVEVYVKKGTLYVSEHCPYQGRRRINFIKFGLGMQTDSSWRVADSALPLNLYVIMSPREKYPVSQLHFSLPRESSLDLAKRWLLVEIQEEALDVPTDQVQKGYAFVHSCEYILTKRGDRVADEIKPCKKL